LAAAVVAVENAVACAVVNPICEAFDVNTLVWA
jgi:hypothetical protein